MSEIQADFRFAIVPEQVVDHEQGGLTANEVRLYALLDRYGNGEGVQATPGRKALARRLGMSLNTLDRAREGLEAKGWLTTLRRTNDTSIYVLHRHPGGGVPTHGGTQILGIPTHGGTPTGGDQQIAFTSGTPSGVPPVPIAGSPPRTRAERGRDNLWDALVAAVGTTPTTETAKGRFRKAHKELRQVGATPEQVEAVGRAYRREWPNVEITPQAITGNWDRFLPRAGHAEPGARAEAWVRDVGAKLERSDFLDMLAERSLPAADSERLTLLYDELSAAVATTDAEPAVVSDEEKRAALAFVHGAGLRGIA